MLCFLHSKNIFKQKILFTVERSTVFFRRPRRFCFPTVRAAVAHSRVKERPNNKKNKCHCLLLLLRLNGPIRRSHKTAPMIKTECVVAVSSSSSPVCPSSLPCFPTQFIPLLLLQDSEVPICILSCSSTQVPQEIWGHVWSSRDGHPKLMPPRLPSRDLYRMNEGKTHRTKLQDCYRCHTDATDIPTFLRVEGEGRRERQDAAISAF